MNVRVFPFAEVSSATSFYQQGDIVIYVSRIGDRPSAVGVVDRNAGDGSVWVRFWWSGERMLAPANTRVYPDSLVRLGRIE